MRRFLKKLRRLKLGDDLKEKGDDLKKSSHD
jgi:hypothetical protein